MFSMAEMQALDGSLFPFREAWELDAPLFRDGSRLGRTTRLHSSPDCPEARKATELLPWELKSSASPGVMCTCVEDDSQEQVAMRREDGLIEMVRDVESWMRAVDELLAAPHERARFVLLVDAIDALRSPFLQRHGIRWVPFEADRDGWTRCGQDHGTYVRDWVTRKYDEAWAMVSSVQAEILRERDRDEPRQWVLMDISRVIEPLAPWTRGITPSRRFRVACVPTAVLDQLVEGHQSMFVLGDYDGELKKDVWQLFGELASSHASGMFGLGREDDVEQRVRQLFTAATLADAFPRFIKSREQRRAEDARRAEERAAAAAAREEELAAKAAAEAAGLADEGAPEDDGAAPDGAEPDAAVDAAPDEQPGDDAGTRVTADVVG